MTHVREKSRFGPCYALGELIGETATRYLYRNRGWDRLRQQKLIDPPRAVHGVRGLSRARRGGLKTPPARGANKSAQEQALRGEDPCRACADYSQRATGLWTGKQTPATPPTSKRRLGTNFLRTGAPPAPEKSSRPKIFWGCPARIFAGAVSPCRGAYPMFDARAPLPSRHCPSSWLAF